MYRAEKVTLHAAIKQLHKLLLNYSTIKRELISISINKQIRSAVTVIHGTQIHGRSNSRRK